MRIFVIDDCGIDRFFTERVIRRTIPGVDVRGFGCPIEALAAITGGEPPSLIILDVNMPSMSGFELLERIPSDRRCRAVMLTSSTWRSDREMAARFPRVHTLIEKPLTKDSLLSFVLAGEVSAAE